jgi:hypothetical protein
VEDCKTDSEIKTTESNVAISDESLVDIASAFEIYNIISADSLRTNTSSHLLRRQSLKKLQANVVTEDSAITNFVTEDSAIVTEDSVTTTTELEEAPQEKVAPLSYGNFSNLQKSPNQK